MMTQPNELNVLGAMPVIETFVTIQGEGRSMGRRAVFVRFYGCSQRCPWCDTPESWAPLGSKVAAKPVSMTASEIAEKVLEVYTEGNHYKYLRECLVVLTGGEPLEQSPHIESVATVLCQMGFQVEFETVGEYGDRTDEIHDCIQRIISVTFPHSLRFTVSPKLLLWDDKKFRAVVNRWLAIRDISPLRVDFKIVVDSAEDLKRLDFLDYHERCAVWVMPKTVKTKDSHKLDDDKASEIAQAALSGGFNYSHRLHLTLDLP